jgi:phage protein D
VSAPAFYAGRSFHVPSFRVELEGRELSRTVISDVLEVSFTDDLEAIHSFELTLYDWDPVGLHPRYSSPWDAEGRPLTADGATVPDFEPGARVSLYFGYAEEGALPLVMAGEVISLSPSFPATGAPTCRIRALDAFLRGLQKTQVSGNYDGTDKDVVDQLCAENDVTVRWDGPENEGEPRSKVEVEGTLYDEIAHRAQAYGLSMITEPAGAGGDAPVLLLGRPAATRTRPVVELEWGRTLVSFTPALSAAGQISEVVVRVADPDAEGDDRQIEVTRTWSDIGLDPSALGPAGATDLDRALGGVQEVVKPDRATTRKDAEQAADKKLQDLARDLVKGSGSSVGLPELRAGQVVTMAGLGARFNGDYRLTKTTHTLGAGGYTTTFEARKEVLKP